MPDEEVEQQEQPQAEAAPVGEDITVEVEKPKGRAAMSDEDLAKSSDVPDDEIARYAEDSQKRIKGLRNAYQEQRRRAEQWSRDASTAANLAEQLYRENQELRKNVSRSEAALIDQATGRAESQLEQARIKAKQAQASGDADLIVAANEDVSRAVSEVERFKLLKPVAESAAAAPPESRAERPAPSAPQPQPGAQISARTRAWVENNAWFGKDNEMTQFAMRQHHHLAVDGITEEANPDLYWRTIESKLKEQFPEKFGGT